MSANQKEAEEWGYYGGREKKENWRSKQRMIPPDVYDDKIKVS